MPYEPDEKLQVLWRSLWSLSFLLAVAAVYLIAEHWQATRLELVPVLARLALIVVAVSIIVLFFRRAPKSAPKYTEIHRNTLSSLS